MDLERLKLRTVSILVLMEVLREAAHVANLHDLDVVFQSLF